jgi:hypothetical protein
MLLRTARRSQNGPALLLNRSNGFDYLQPWVESGPVATTLSWEGNGPCVTSDNISASSRHGEGDSDTIENEIRYLCGRNN